MCGFFISTAVFTIRWRASISIDTMGSMTDPSFSPAPPRRDNTEASPQHTPVNPTLEHPINQGQAFASQGHLHSSAAGASNPTGKKPPKGTRKWLPHTKKQWIITSIIAVLLIGGGIAAYFIWFKPDSKPAPKKAAAKVEPAPKPVPIYSNLTGVEIADAAVNDRSVTGIMIENSPDARPQSGINQAGVVFEAVAEGGITRFLTLYQDSEPGYIGPVRSVRPYYLQWLLGFNAPIAHVGGSAEALQLIKTWGVKDLDQGANPAYFKRISSRYAPHNVYTSIASLWELEAKKGFGKSEFTPLARKDDKASTAPNATSIDFALSGALYNPHFDYDPATNGYKRSQAGAPHMVVDEAGAQLQIMPKTVVGLVMPQGRNGIYTTYETIGSGEAFIFQDGMVTPGTWEKANNTSNFVFKDAAGAPVALNRGNTWFTALGSAGAVTYK